MEYLLNLRASFGVAADIVPVLLIRIAKVMFIPLLTDAVQGPISEFMTNQYITNLERLNDSWQPRSSDHITQK